MRKSSALSSHYRPGTSQIAGSTARLRDQMADFARAERLQKLRAATHQSREQIAAEIGVTAKTLYSWEHGGKIKWPNAVKIADFYGVDPESLVSRDITATGSAEPSQLDRIEEALEDLLERVGAIERQLQTTTDEGADRDLEGLEQSEQSGGRDAPAVDAEDDRAADDGE